MDISEWINQVEQTRVNIPESASRRTDYDSLKQFFKVPPDVREEHDEFVFEPLKVSIGPYHHGKESLRSGQLLKEQCLPRFLNRNPDKNFADYVDALAQRVDDLRGMYDQLDPAAWLDENKKDAFLQMMVVDGCFLLEMMLQAHDGGSVLFDPNEMEIYRHDMLLLENQIPLEVLVDLASVQNPEMRRSVDIRRLMANLLHEFGPFTTYAIENFSCLHILEWYQYGLMGVPSFSAHFHVYTMQVYPAGIRKMFLHCCFWTQREKDEKTFTTLHFNIPSATALKEAQIGIRMSRTPSLMDISMSHTTLRLPQINVDDTTKYIFHNLILLERLCPHVEIPLVTSYVYFMNGLLKGPGDISLLRMLGIINTTLHDAEVADLFNGLSNSTWFSRDNLMIPELREAGQRLRERYNKNSEEWRKDLIQRCLKSPWAIISVIAAILIFSFTAIQTIYTVLSYYKGK